MDVEDVQTTKEDQQVVNNLFLTRYPYIVMTIIVFIFLFLGGFSMITNFFDNTNVAAYMIIQIVFVPLGAAIEFPGKKKPDNNGKYYVFALLLLLFTGMNLVAIVQEELLGIKEPWVVIFLVMTILMLFASVFIFRKFLAEGAPERAEKRRQIQQSIDERVASLIDQQKEIIEKWRSQTQEKVNEKQAKMDEEDQKVIQNIQKNCDKIGEEECSKQIQEYLAISNEKRKAMFEEIIKEARPILQNSLDTFHQNFRFVRTNKSMIENSIRSIKVDFSETEFHYEIK